MIWIVLFDTQRSLQGYVEFRALPVTGHDDYRCTPDGMLSLERAMKVSKDLNLGGISGWVEGYRWYRQVKNPGTKLHRD